MDAFERSLKTIIVPECGSVPGNMPGLIRLLEEELPGSLEHLDMWFDPTLLETDIFHDAWGRPIELVVVAPREYILLSAGPNGRYEGGAADDVTYAFDPLGPYLGYRRDPCNP